MCKYIGGRNYIHLIPREGSHIRGSRCNTWKHWKTILQSKHCRYFWWLHPTVQKGEQQHKNDGSGSTFHISHLQKPYTRSSAKVKMPLMESIVAVQFKKGSSMLHYKESFLEESYATINFLQSSFLKKGGLKTFPTTSTECCGITKSKRDNIMHTLKGVPPSAHSFWNSNNTSPYLCCSRDILAEEEC